MTVFKKVNSIMIKLIYFPNNSCSGGVNFLSDGFSTISCKWYVINDSLKSLNWFIIEYLLLLSTLGWW